MCPGRRAGDREQHRRSVEQPRGGDLMCGKVTIGSDRLDCVPVRLEPSTSTGFGD
jgi:hypothetical protein